MTKTKSRDNSFTLDIYRPYLRRFMHQHKSSMKKTCLLKMIKMYPFFLENEKCAFFSLRKCCFFSKTWSDVPLPSFLSKIMHYTVCILNSKLLCFCFKIYFFTWWSRVTEYILEGQFSVTYHLSHIISHLICFWSKLIIL